MGKLGRQFTFLAVMIILSLGIAAAFIWAMTYREGGIFDSGFASRMQLKTLTSKGEEVIPGLPSTTIFLESNAETAVAEDPAILLTEVGAAIRKSVATEDAVSSQVTNVDYVSPTLVDTAHHEFRFDASTSVDYDTETYEQTVAMFGNLSKSEKFTDVSLKSSPTPDGGRSINLDVSLASRTDDTDANAMLDAWDSVMISMSRISEDMDNLSSVTLRDRGFVMKAEFYDDATITAATELTPAMKSLVAGVYDKDMQGDTTVEESELFISPISNDASSFTTTFVADITEQKFAELNSGLESYLTHKQLLPAPWTTVMQVEGNPDLQRVIFGTSVTW